MKWVVGVAGLCAVGAMLWLLNPATPAADGERVVMNQEVLAIVLTPDGFQPKEPTIRVGTVVTFSNTTGREYWPASDLHPSHAIYAAFDPLRPLQPDESWSFTFDKVGTWGLHYHIRSYYTGLIHVVE